MDAFKFAPITLFKIDLFGSQSKTHIDLIRESVCYNQGELAQYSYLAGEKHKALKDELRKPSPNVSEVRRLVMELENHLNIELKKVVMKNFENMKKFFHGRAKREPRICIKGVEEGMIVDLFREEQNQLYMKDSRAEENKGFQYVVRTGKWFFCNNIPRAVKSRRYYNPRLDEFKAVHYKRSRIWNFINQLRGAEDDKWIDCWELIDLDGHRVAPDAEQCYKSTLITPMTLLGNTLSREFMSQFRIQQEPERAIYGFLCLDHHHTNYFNKNIDVWVSYIFADLLSLYLITSLIYSEYSKTYQAAKRI